MRHRILCFFIFLISFVSVAQEYLVNGVVRDANNNPISFANVLITNFNKTNQTPKGTSTDEKGYFIIDNLESGNYKLKISFIGYETYSIDLEITKNLKLDNIVLKENLEELDGVTVVAKRPTVKRLVDRVVFNVENSTLSNSNVLDVLKNTPGVIVSDGSITVKQSIPTIYINDRKVHLSVIEVQQLLEGTSATNIKSIEVITNPPAKYEAEGGAVLNIVTSKNIVAGYHGSVFGNYNQGSQYPKYSFGTSHFFKAKKLNTYLNYNISPRKDFRNNLESYNFFDNNNQVVSIWETDYNRTRESSNHNINANVDYEIDKNNSLGFSTNSLISPRENIRTKVNSKTNIYDANGVLDSLFITDNRLVDETFNLAFTIDYLHKFKKEGEKLSVSGHHTNYDFSNFQNVYTGYFLPTESDSYRDNRFQTFSSQVIKLYTGQLDYELPINDSAQFEAGTKVSIINSENILNQFIFVNDIKEEDLDNSDEYLYDEINYAAYLSYAKDWRRWSLKTGLRTEYTSIKGNTLSSNALNNNDYLKFFPSVHLLHQINDNSNLYLNYKKRINRPRYSALNPFKYFSSDNSYSTGNPKLRPQIDDVVTLGYTYNKDYTFELYYRKEKDPVTEIIFQDNESNLIKYIFSNTDAISYGLDFMTYTQVIPNWNVYALASAFYYEDKVLALESNNALYTIEKWSFYGQVINYFTFLKDKSLTADVAYLYISPIIEGPSTVYARHGLDINLRKSFWNNRATLNVGFTDVFNTKNETYTTMYLNQDIKLKSMVENRMLIVGFNYKFGNYKLTSNKKDIELSERDRL